MNRNDELAKLQRELENTPLPLDFTLERARAKRDEKRKKTAKKAIFAPLGAIAAAFAVFALLVNVMPGFAYAAGRIPLIKELALAVAGSPSLSAAVENEYVQPIEQRQTINGITARIEYAIVDQKQLNLFYTVESGQYPSLETRPELSRSNGEFFSGGISYGGDADDEGIRKVTASFWDSDAPNELNVTLSVYKSTGDEYAESRTSGAPEEAELLAEFHFSVSVDPYYTAQGELIELNETLELDGQRLFLSSAEIYPTHMRFAFDADADNSAWLKAMELYVENEKGERFDGVSNGVSAFGDSDSPMVKTYILESAFFAESKELTMYITGVSWLEKDFERALIDLENKSADRLPEGVRLESAVREGDDWRLVFSAPLRTGEGGYWVFGWNYYGLDGTEYSLDSKGVSRIGAGSGGQPQQGVRLEEQFVLSDYPDTQVYLLPLFSKRVELSQPVMLKIK